ncbi:MAG TPA: 2-dehydropantoate 2-reductase N-terminal domain-containing protein [Polyangiaceae bacterium]
MHVCIVGAGALGSVYGARLARFGGCEVSVVARSAAPAVRERLERVEDGEALAWDVPPRTTEAPRQADVILAFVRYEQLSTLPPRVAASEAPVVVMTPMMPQDHAELAAAIPGRVLTGMPSVVSYRNDAGAIRYWLPRLATTFVESREPPAMESELVARLERAEMRAKLAPNVLERNVATTVSFIPIAMALDVAGSVDALLGNDALLALALDAAAEGRELGKTVGKAEAWASMLLKFVGPRTLKMGVGLARSRAPEAVLYAEEHFGRKLHAQNVAMAGRMLDLARDKGVSAPALAELHARLGSAAPARRGPES